MAHKHSIYDNDQHFMIDPITRSIVNKASQKNTLIQYDHNSERFTFEIPRYIDGHDMSQCDVVEVHYLNINPSTKEQNSGVYLVEDLQISPHDDDIVICSWLISQGATRLSGALNFLIRFICTTDGVVEYAWNTAICSSINISSGIYNEESVDEQYTDILLTWYNTIVEGFDVLIEQQEHYMKDEIPLGNMMTILEAYPIGSIYLSVVDTNPRVFFGGTWERIKDRFLLSAGDTYTAESTGGSATHAHASGGLYAQISTNIYNPQTQSTVPNAFIKLNEVYQQTKYDTNAVVQYASATVINPTNHEGALLGARYGTGVGGETAESSNMPPYLTVYMWKRIA